MYTRVPEIYKVYFFYKTWRKFTLFFLNNCTHRHKPDFSEKGIFEKNHYIVLTKKINIPKLRKKFDHGIPFFAKGNILRTWRPCAVIWQKFYLEKILPINLSCCVNFPGHFVFLGLFRKKKINGQCLRFDFSQRLFHEKTISSYSFLDFRMIFHYTHKWSVKKKIRNRVLIFVFFHL